jgi:UDP-N-acetylglucosamine acyltransferase
MTLMMSELVHPTALVSPEAELAPDVQVGPYAIIEGPVRVGPGCVIEGHACLNGPLTMGANNFVGHGAVLGKSPQSRAYRGEPTHLRIGDGNTFREYVTVHRGTAEGGGETSIGDHNLLMINSHLGHDVRMGNRCTLVNNALVAGHVQLDDGCILSGQTAVQQRVRIGRLAMLGGMGATTKDVPPFVLQQGWNCVTGLNVIGMRRAGIAPAAIDAMRAAYRILFKEGRTLKASIERMEADLGDVAEVREFLEFLRTTRLGISPARDNDRFGRGGMADGPGDD